MNEVVAPDCVSFPRDTIGGVAGWCCEPTEAELGVVKGGWFNWGSAQSFRHLVGHIARSARAKALVPDYRLAPENPFPTAVDDVRAATPGLCRAACALLHRPAILRVATSPWYCWQ